MLLKYNANCYSRNARGYTVLEIADALNTYFPLKDKKEILRSSKNPIKKINLIEATTIGIKIVF